MNESTKNWLAMVDYDIDTARHMHETARYVYVVFMCHLAIEKMFKAIVGEETNNFPPKTHDLIHLLNLGKIELSPDLIDFIGIINNAAIVTRYPEDLPKLVSSYPQDVAKKYLDKTLEIIKCVKQDKRLKA